MNTYSIDYGGHTGTAVAATRGKAKYDFFREHELGDLMSFGGFVCSAKCRLLHKFSVQDLFTQNIEDFERMKAYRNIPFAFLGMRVEVNGKPGRIIGYTHGFNLMVCFDGQAYGSNCHPHYRVKYFDNHGNLLKEYGD